MLRLLYLLFRQAQQRRERVPRAGDHASRVTLFIVAMCVMAGALALLIYSNGNVLRLAHLGAPHASLELRVDEIGSTPLVVFLEKPGLPTLPIDASLGTVRIVSVNSSFQPTFQVAPIAANIEVSNEDAIAHNTHVFDGSRTLFNVALPSAGVHVHKSLGRVGILDVRCDLHSWMHAWIFVPPSNGHHATIWHKGKVTLPNIAPGEYQMHTWTPSVGESTQVLVIEAGKTKSLRLAIP